MAKLFWRVPYPPELTVLSEGQWMSSLRASLPIPYTIWGSLGELLHFIFQRFCVPEPGQPHFPNRAASGLLGVNWAELFLPQQRLTRCLKWECVVSRLQREAHTWFSLSFSFNIWNDLIITCDYFMSEYIREAECHFPVDLVIRKTIRTHTSRDLRSERGNSSALQANSPVCWGN